MAVLENQSNTTSKVEKFEQHENMGKKPQAADPFADVRDGGKFQILKEEKEKALAILKEKKMLPDAVIDGLDEGSHNGGKNGGKANGGIKDGVKDGIKDGGVKDGIKDGIKDGGIKDGVKNGGKGKDEWLDCIKPVPDASADGLTFDPNKVPHDGGMKDAIKKPNLDGGPKVAEVQA
jgi:hypothetical protein